MREKHWSYEDVAPIGHGRAPTNLLGRPRRSVAWAHEKLDDPCATAADRQEAEMTIAHDAITRPDPYEPE